MSGYNGYSKSNNAIDAEERNCFPASITAKMAKVPTGFIKNMIKSTEWHHTSSHYNETAYYDVTALIRFLETTEGKLALADFKANKPKHQSFDNCRVEWLEWSAKRGDRPDEKKATGCTVEFRGKTATITLQNGDTFQKRITTNGFYVSHDDVHLRRVIGKLTHRRDLYQNSEPERIDIERFSDDFLEV